MVITCLYLLPFCFLINPTSTFRYKNFTSKIYKLLKTINKTISDTQQSQDFFCNHKHWAKSYSIGNSVLLSTHNLNLPGIYKSQTCFVGPFQVVAIGLQSSFNSLPASLFAPLFLNKYIEAFCY